MSKTFILTINLDAKCRRCGKGGATPNGLCLACVARAIKRGECDHIINRIKPKMKQK